MKFKIKKLECEKHLHSIKFRLVVILIMCRFFLYKIFNTFIYTIIKVSEPIKSCQLIPVCSAKTKGMDGLLLLRQQVFINNTGVLVFFFFFFTTSPLLCSGLEFYQLYTHSRKKKKKFVHFTKHSCKGG